MTRRDFFCNFIVNNDIRRVQKGGFFKPDINKRRLHARQYAAYFPAIYIANQAALGVTLYMYLLQYSVFNQRNA
jgi:hypothetical protein